MKAAAAVLMFLASSACGTIAHGRFQSVPVQSNPAGAHVAVNCGAVPVDGGTTPVAVKLQRKASNCSITLSKEGFADARVEFKQAIAGVFWANVIPGVVIGGAADFASASGSFLSDNPYDRNDSGGGLLWMAAVTGASMLVDHNTGAMYKLEPTRVEVVLDRKP